MKNYVFTITARGLLDCALTFLVCISFSRGDYIKTLREQSVFPERTLSPLGLFDDMKYQIVIKAIKK